jgi:hypothetical protein
MATATPTSAPGPKVNHIGLPVLEYRGGKSTLCAGCGHNSISERIIDAMFEMGVEPERVMKMSGIGCSSKSPAYFMSRSHSFNSVHGRMPSVSTGAILANHTMTMLGVSGDGDTASIGMGQFVHLLRRNLPMIYIIEDNGVYGLTKGQFSATADIGSRLKTGVINDLPAIDTCALAIQLGATFVGRSFSGDKKQLLSMLKAAQPRATSSCRRTTSRSTKSDLWLALMISTLITTRARYTKWRCTTAQICASASCSKTTTPLTRRTRSAPLWNRSKTTKSSPVSSISTLRSLLSSTC